MNAEASRGLRIVQIVERLDIGGLERLAVDLALAEKAAGHTPSIYTVFRRGELASEAEASGVAVLNFGKAPGFSPEAVWALAEQLRSDRADIVHTHAGGIHHYGVAAARLAGVPVVVNTRHGLGTLHSPWRQNLYFRATMPFTDAVVCVCEDARQFFVHHRGVPAAKAHVILNGIPLGKFQGHRAHPGERAGVVRFGTVGRMVRAKANAVLVEAFALVLRELPRAELHLVGGGPLEAEVRAQVKRLELSEHVCLHGVRRDIAEALEGLDVFVLSSISEGLPVAVQEAMAVGLPVVSTRVGGTAEVAPEGRVAWYCEPGDSTGLARVMLECVHSGRLAEAGEEASRIAFADFSIEHTQTLYESLFRSLLTPRSELA